ncbi:hypothetical protein [Streptomyces sp. TP-A0356]|uniref:hypothetical protein n=1 Tax=Streptomyces sp. TP-A0356 TaxID=1359208 RepID=UPI0006E31DA6|nr:hypothetical protein [Streptomyces sp. TP-A0356]
MSAAREHPSGGPQPSRDRFVVGLIAAPGLASDLAEDVAQSLAARLRERFPTVEWEVVARPDPRAGSVVGAGVDLIQLARDVMFEEGWRFAVCLTDLPLHVGRRPVTAHASVTLGVGVVSVPALGAMALYERVIEATSSILDQLVTQGQSQDRRHRPAGGRRGRRRLRARVRELEELTSPVGRAYVQDEETVRFLTAAGQGNLRLLLGMVRANRPWRLIAGLSRSLVAALGVGAFGMTSPPIWLIADSMNAPRMTVLALGSVLAIGGTLIVAHRLWERSPSPSPAVRERVALINLATVLTVLLGVLTLYLALLVITSVCAGALIPPKVIEAQLHHPAGAANYLRIAWAVTSLATLGGALGAALENDLAVREAAYGYRPSERSGTAGDAARPSEAPG